MLSLWQRWVYYIFILWWRMVYFLGIYTPPARPKTYIEENSEFITPLKTRFLATYDNPDIQFNENIDPLFYNKKDFAEYMTEANNSLETVWKTRILWENTPRGNILMFYDAYKLGFSFYCDQKVISYDVLNAVAMKYVTVYRCRHFFFDETDTPREHISPLIKIHALEDTPTAKPAIDVKKTFVKLKDYHKENPNAKIKPPQKTPATNEPEKRKNTFLYLGKLNNFRMTQNFPKPHRVLAKFTSPLLATLGLPNQKFSYKEFVEARKKATQVEAEAFAEASASAETI